MTEDAKPVWLWSTDEENWSCGDEFDTREVAVAEALAELGDAANRHFWTGQKAAVAIVPPDGDDVVEHMACNVSDQVGEHADEWPDATKAQVAELGALVRDVTIAWLERHGLMPGFYRVVDVEEHHVPDQEDS